jgi:hypothetical protein
MARRREAVEPEHRRADDVHVLLGDGCELAPQPVEVVAVQPTRAHLEPRGVDEVRLSDFRDVHLEPRVLADEHTRRARVVEMNVRKEQMAHVRQDETALRQLRLQRRDARRRSAVLEREPVLGLDEVDADDALDTFVVQIKRIRRARRHAPDPKARS